MGNSEQPDYTVVQSKGTIEIRDYTPMIVAEVEVSGERKTAIRKGFRILADYIFGNNLSRKKMQRIEPVENESSEKIPMTAPVMQQQENDKWKVRFVMSKKYSLETLPTPRSKEILLIAVPSRRFAVIRFSGLPHDETIKRHTKELTGYMKAENLKPIANAVLAFYHPPWTLPFLRRNEVMIEIGMDP